MLSCGRPMLAIDWSWLMADQTTRSANVLRRELTTFSTLGRRVCFPTTSSAAYARGCERATVVLDPHRR